MTETSVEHTTLTRERDYPFSAAEFCRAHVDPAHRRKWFVEGEGWQVFGALQEYLAAQQTLK